MTATDLALSLALGVALTLPTAATSETRNCAPHEQITERLAERYSESRQIIALSADSSVMELFASPESGTWTIVVTRAGGPTCVVAAGEYYQHVAEDLPNTDNGA